MLRKILALLVAIMLMMPVTVLAKASPGFAANDQVSPVYSSQDSHEGSDAETGDESGDINDANDNSGSDDGKVEVEQKEQKEQKEKKERKEKDKNKDSDEDKSNNDGDLKQTADMEDNDEATATVKIKRNENKLTVKIKGTIPDSNSTTGKARGIQVAMKAVIKNMSNVGGNAVNALENVVNKFASWLGLGPIFTDANQPSSGNTGGTGSGETSTTAGVRGI